MKEVIIIWMGIHIMAVTLAIMTIPRSAPSMPKYEYMLDVNSEDSVTVYNPRTGKSVKVGFGQIKEVVLIDNI